jgi:hypothetical protein
MCSRNEDNVPVVYMGRYEVVLRGGLSITRGILGGGAVKIETFLGLEMSGERIANLEKMSEFPALRNNINTNCFLVCFLHY